MLLALLHCNVQETIEGNYEFKIPLASAVVGT
jgi:hypothetical protein